jgi:hypothetical protein
MQLEISVIIPLFLAASLAVQPAAAGVNTAPPVGGYGVSPHTKRAAQSYFLSPQFLADSNARQEKQEKLAKACPGPYKTLAEMQSCQSKLPQEMLNGAMRKDEEGSVKNGEAEKEKRERMSITAAGMACSEQYPHNLTAFTECLQGRPLLVPSRRDEKGSIEVPVVFKA